MAIRQRPQFTAPAAAGYVQQHRSIRLGRRTCFWARYHRTDMRRGTQAGNAPSVVAAAQHRYWSVLGTTAFFVPQGDASRTNGGKVRIDHASQKSGLQPLTQLISLCDEGISNFENPTVAEFQSRKGSIQKCKSARRNASRGIYPSDPEPMVNLAPNIRQLPNQSRHSIMSAGRRVIDHSRHWQCSRPKSTVKRTADVVSVAGVGSN